MDGELNWLKETNTTPIRKLEDGRLSAASGEMFEIVTGKDGTTTYLTRSGRAFKKQ